MKRPACSGDHRLNRDRWRLSWRLAVILSLGFATVAAFTYANALNAARRQVVESTLPLTLDALSADLKQEFVRPILFSSAMAANTLLIDWQTAGEEPVQQVQTYLKRVQAQHGATTTFFVSDRTGRYFHPDGVLKTVKPGSSQDSWYFRLRSSPAPYEVNLDRDTADLDRYTVFVNYKLVDGQGNFHGAVGLGRSSTQLSELIREAEQRHGIQVMFVDPKGRILFGDQGQPEKPHQLQQWPGLGAHSQRILRQGQDSFSYREGGQEIFVRTRRIPELNWVLLVRTPPRLPEGYLLDSLVRIISIALLTLALALVLVFQVTGRHHDKLETLAFTDPLSGALNRSAFAGLSRTLVEKARRSAQPLGLALMDIDHFKRINDRFGHPAGDGVIRQVADHIRNSTRGGDLLFRWGGEEFLLLLPRLDLEQARVLMERLGAAVAERVGPDLAEDLRVTLSIGITVWRDKDTLETVLERADRALYRAKDGGRNQVVSG
ncbi:MAG: sensor domain-containing diguanylate cyclase [Cyanobacteriota bacterium]|nr:sensor domain-containing diguanylate cyclase [Cyanobacteriota bacterium]